LVPLWSWDEIGQRGNLEGHRCVGVEQEIALEEVDHTEDSEDCACEQGYAIEACWSWMHVIFDMWSNNITLTFLMLMIILVYEFQNETYTLFEGMANG